MFAELRPKQEEVILHFISENDVRICKSSHWKWKDLVLYNLLPGISLIKYANSRAYSISVIIVYSGSTCCSNEGSAEGHDG